MADNKIKKVIVIGSGAGGATIANELSGRYQVTILETGGGFKPFSLPINKMAGLRKTGLLMDERMIRMLLPNMMVQKTSDMVMVRGIGLGGTTTLATGNAVRYDGALRDMGIDLDDEFKELYEELPITTDHQKHWTKTTRDMYNLFEEMGLNPVVTPKFLNDSRKCVECGHCAIGCPTGAKWDTRKLIESAVNKGAEIINNCKVTKLEIHDNKVTAVHAKVNGRRVIYKADLIILAAGGIGSPEILERSGIKCQDTLFADPVLCVAGSLECVHQERQILMPFISQQDGYILSPYMDYLSFFFNKKWYSPMQNIVSIMIKLSDESKGSVHGSKIIKSMTGTDNENMDKAIAKSREILEKMGIPREKQFMGTLNAGHPGGMLPLTKEDKDTLHNSHLPENMYVADATILPRSMGNPPILTIMALAKKISKIVN